METGLATKLSEQFNEETHYSMFFCFVSPVAQRTGGASRFRDQEVLKDGGRFIGDVN